MSKSSIAVYLFMMTAIMLTAGICEEERQLTEPLWCGERLCDWTVSAGQVERVATWHKKDLGVSFLGDHSAISQIVGSEQHCFTVMLMADQDGQCQLNFNVDVNSGERPNLSRPIRSNGWSVETFVINLPPFVEDVRFTIEKTGPGRCVLARVDWWDDGKCTPNYSLLTDLPLGIRCVTEANCHSEICAPTGVEGDVFWFDSRCVECTADDQCAADQICGIDYVGAFAQPHRSCVDPAAKVLGERCADDRECQQGVCYRGQCSGCREDGDCASGSHCISFDAQDEFLPFQCSPGDQAGVTGEPCLRDSDCRSSVCDSNYMLSLCERDGQRCLSPEDCPITWEESIVWSYDQLESRCHYIGRRGGVCQ